MSIVATQTGPAILELDPRTDPYDESYSEQAGVVAAEDGGQD